MQNIAAYLQCHKQPTATYVALWSYRSIYPDTTIVLVSDNGYDYTEMAKHFNCIYIHCNENVLLIYRDLSRRGHIENAHKLIQRVSDAFKLCKEEFVMWLEDDVSVNHLITEQLKYHVNGFCPNIHSKTQISRLRTKYPYLDLKREYRFTGHGGSIFHKDFFINTMDMTNNDKNVVIDDILENWLNYDFPTEICQDFLFSILITLSGGTIGPYKGHGDHYKGLNTNLVVQHQYKYWYNKPLPDQYKHLVKLT